MKKSPMQRKLWRAYGILDRAHWIVYHALARDVAIWGKDPVMIAHYRHFKRSIGIAKRAIIRMTMRPDQSTKPLA